MIRRQPRSTLFPSTPLSRSGHVCNLECFDHLLEIALHHAIQIINSQSDPVIGQTILGKIVSPNFFFATAGADLATSLRAVFFRSEEHTSELQSQSNLVCRLL